MRRTYSLTAASVDMTAAASWQEITGIAEVGQDGAVGDKSMGAQGYYVDAVHSASGASGVIGFAWYDPDAAKVIKYEAMTFADSGRRTALAGAAGDYVQDVQHPVTQLNFVRSDHAGQFTNTTGTNKIKLYAGFVSGTSGTLTVGVTPTRNA